MCETQCLVCGEGPAWLFRAGPQQSAGCGLGVVQLEEGRSKRSGAQGSVRRDVVLVIATTSLNPLSRFEIPVRLFPWC